MSLQPVRGTHDLLPEDARRHNWIVSRARILSERFGFQEMVTPIFEFQKVFDRTLGESSDIVHKEMYAFKDRGGESLVLRPEGTAGIARAFISNGLSHQLPFKAFYQGPMFRYERPQKGRQRQFHQIGVELMGVQTPIADLECIQLAQWVLDDLGITEDTTLHLNSIGDQESRHSYQRALVEYLDRFEAELSDDSRLRLKTNPLRILDSKNETDQKIIAGAPNLCDHLTSSAQEFFSDTQRLLSEAKIAFQVTPTLVRGLDYYSHVVFEYRTTKLGAQDAVIAGGRYDRLVELMGGPQTPGVGWAAGIERLAMLCKEPPEASPPVALVAIGPEGERFLLKVAQDLRRSGWSALMTYSGNLSKRMKKAQNMGARIALIAGDSEAQSQTVTLKDLSLGRQFEVPVAEVHREIATIYAANSSDPRATF